jgi:hypothetical protein
MTRLDLSDDKREALLRLIEAVVRDSRYPFSPETEALKRIAERLPDEEMVPAAGDVRSGRLLPCSKGELQA